VAAGQSGMGVDDVNRSLSVEPRHLGQQASVEPPPRARQAQIPGNLRVAKPIRRRRRARLLSTMMEGGDGDDAGSDSKVLNCRVDSAMKQPLTSSSAEGKNGVNVKT